jgi:hypothetical protein
VSGPLPEELTDAALEARLFPDASTKQGGDKLFVDLRWATRCR